MITEMNYIIVDINRQNDVLLKENQRLREALQPFAEFGSDALDSDYERAKEVLNDR